MDVGKNAGLIVPITEVRLLYHLTAELFTDDTLKKATNRLMNHQMILTGVDDETHDSGY